MGHLTCGVLDTRQKMYNNNNSNKIIIIIIQNNDDVTWERILLSLPTRVIPTYNNIDFFIYLRNCDITHGRILHRVYRRRRRQCINIWMCFMCYFKKMYQKVQNAKQTHDVIIITIFLFFYFL